MMRFIRQWWFIRQLYKESSEHCVSQTDEFLLANGKTEIERAAFLKQICRKFEDGPQKEKRKMNEYNSIINSCIEDKYIEQNIRQGALEPKGRPFIITTTAGEDMMGYSDLIERLLSKYSFLWGIIWSIIAFFAGIFVDNLLNFIE